MFENISFNMSILDKITSHKDMNLKLFIQNNQYKLSKVSITKSPTPVTKPTTRGGVYFSEKYEYRISGVINDVSISPLLSKMMLGPNKEFGDIQIRGKMHDDTELNIHTNLIRTVQDESGIELHMMIVKVV